MLSMNISFSGDSYFHSNFLAFQLLLDKAFIKMTGKDPSTYEVCPVITYTNVSYTFNLYYRKTTSYCAPENKCTL
jgi:hypothetical protein